MLCSIYPSTTTTNWVRENREREQRKKTKSTRWFLTITFDPDNNNQKSLPHSSPPGWVSFRFNLYLLFFFLISKTLIIFVFFFILLLSWRKKKENCVIFYIITIIIRCSHTHRLMTVDEHNVLVITFSFKWLYVLVISRAWVRTETWLDLIKRKNG